MKNIYDCLDRSGWYKQTFFAELCLQGSHFEITSKIIYLEINILFKKMNFKFTINFSYRSLLNKLICKILNYQMSANFDEINVIL